ncbi:hypothetical protein HanIR_Chr02g0062251 [Helianthus annuus]|nr:hypothetical protein HanIR_Chr02g0062251 [Helianthus annuus]
MYYGLIYMFCFGCLWRQKPSDQNRGKSYVVSYVPILLKIIIIITWKH